jgi:hypothetical protein
VEETKLPLHPLCHDQYNQERSLGSKRAELSTIIALRTKTTTTNGEQCPKDPKSNFSGVVDVLVVDRGMRPSRPLVNGRGKRGVSRMTPMMVSMGTSRLRSFGYRKRRRGRVRRIGDRKGGSESVEKEVHGSSLCSTI